MFLLTYLIVALALVFIALGMLIQAVRHDLKEKK